MKLAPVRVFSCEQALKPRANGRNIIGYRLPTFLDVTCCVRLHTMLHFAACCCVLLGVVAYPSNSSPTAHPNPGSESLKLFQITISVPNIRCNFLKKFLFLVLYIKRLVRMSIRPSALTGPRKESAKQTENSWISSAGKAAQVAVGEQIKYNCFY